MRKTHLAPAPKPCPRCYAPMRQTPAGFACDRHGTPDPQGSAPWRKR